jgi:hypothetical protein
MNVSLFLLCVFCIAITPCWADLTFSGSFESTDSQVVVLGSNVLSNKGDSVSNITMSFDNIQGTKVLLVAVYYDSADSWQRVAANWTCEDYVKNARGVANVSGTSGQTYFSVANYIASHRWYLLALGCDAYLPFSANFKLQWYDTIFSVPIAVISSRKDVRAHLAKLPPYIFSAAVQCPPLCLLAIFES